MVKKSPSCENIDENEVQDWVTADEQEEFTDQDIVNAVLGTENKDEDYDDDVSAQPTPVVTAEKGLEALKVIIKFF